MSEPSLSHIKDLYEPAISEIQWALQCTISSTALPTLSRGDLGGPRGVSDSQGFDMFRISFLLGTWNASLYDELTGSIEFNSLGPVKLVVAVETFGVVLSFELCRQLVGSSEKIEKYASIVAYFSV